MNSKWQIYRVGLVDFWYYDEEEFYFLDGRMLLRGANGSGKSVTMQSFIPLLLDGNMRPERLDPFGSRARKMENYLLEEGDDREERTGYLYMELKRTESREFLTLGIGMRARRNKKLEPWYFCITDGRRVGKDFYLYKDVQNKIACTRLELRNRIGEGGRVMETQSEYAQCVNRLLFGFETQEEYKELLELLIQLRTPKLSKDFKPTVINEILSSSLQTLSEDDLRPMSEAIENMDNLKTNLETLKDSLQAARQIEKVYDQYNQIVLYDKALLFTKTAGEHRDLEKKALDMDKELQLCREERQQEQRHYEALLQEEKVLTKERDSLADSDAAKLKEQELVLEKELQELRETRKGKESQEEEKKEKRLEIQQRLQEQTEKNEMVWKEIEDTLEEMEAEIEEVPFDEFAFMKKELWDARGEAYSFQSHRQLLKDYTQKVEKGKEILTEEKSCEEKYSKVLQELDTCQEEKSKAERELLQYENLLHETKQELIEEIYKWEKGNQELHVRPEVLQEISRGIEAYDTETDYWEIRNLGKPDLEYKQKELGEKLAEKRREWKAKQEEYNAVSAELEEWKQKKEPEPPRSPAVEENRRRLREKGIPYEEFYKLVDFDKKLSSEQAARLEEALLHMGLLDALLIPSEYRKQVFSADSGACDRYIFSDADYVKSNLSALLEVENGENDILLYQRVSHMLSAVGWKTGDAETQQGRGSWIDEKGNYGMGILEGTVTKEYTPCFIGISAREQYRQRKLQELETLCQGLKSEETELAREAAALEQREAVLGQEWLDFPKEKDLKTAAKEFEKGEYQVELLTEKTQQQRALAEKERKALDELRRKVQEICQKCYLPARLDLFAQTLAALSSYQECLTKLQILYGNYTNGLSNAAAQEENLEGIDWDLDEILHDLNRTIRKQQETEGSLASVRKQLALTDYEQIKERLDACLVRLGQIPGERDMSVRKSSKLEDKEQQLLKNLEENQITLQKSDRLREWLCQVFEKEYRLDYVEKTFVRSEDMEEQAQKVCAMLAGSFGNKKQSDLFGSLQEVYHQNRGYLLEYQITLRSLFEELDEETSVFDRSMKRIDIGAKYRGISVKFKELIEKMNEDAQVQMRLLSDKDRELFEDILANTISKKIRGKIQASKRWVEKMNHLMESMQTSSGLKLSLRWKNKRAEKEEQLDTKALVELLQKDAEIMRPEEAQRLSEHFRSKIQEARTASNDLGNVQSFHGIMREVLDYRQWFEFQLECQKTGEKKKELTDRVFFTFSGGEKAMAMYVPLFSAVVAKYAGARADAPKLISLDEAFAGVDEMNIRDMFRLMVEFEFNFMINSQILWGDYDTVPGLAIYQLVRPENARYVTVIRYKWNGHSRQLAGDKEMEEYGA